MGKVLTVVAARVAHQRKADPFRDLKSGHAIAVCFGLRKYM